MITDRKRLLCIDLVVFRSEMNISPSPIVIVVDFKFYRHQRSRPLIVMKIVVKSCVHDRRSFVSIAFSCSQFRETHRGKVRNRSEFVF